jgi:hypothetical protein
MKQTLITDFYKSNKKNKKIYGFNPITMSWHCILCGIDIGKYNPRQYCGKSHCYNK